MATRLFLKRLKRELNIPVMGLVDSDPYGLKILSVYMSGEILSRGFSGAFPWLDGLSNWVLFQCLNSILMGPVRESERDSMRDVST